MVAQPPFSMTDRRFHDETLLNSTNFAGASAWCWNFSTQIGASTATTAVSARWVAIRSAVLPSVHPSDENPTEMDRDRAAAGAGELGMLKGDAAQRADQYIGHRSKRPCQDNRMTGERGRE